MKFSSADNPARDPDDDLIYVINGCPETEADIIIRRKGVPVAVFTYQVARVNINIGQVTQWAGIPPVVVGQVRTGKDSFKIEGTRKTMTEFSFRNKAAARVDKKGRIEDHLL